MSEAPDQPQRQISVPTAVGPDAKSDLHESLLLELRPAPAFIVLRHWRWVVFFAMVGLAAFFGHLYRLTQGVLLWTAVMCLLGLLAVLFWSSLVRLAERYTLTRAEAAWESGVVQRLRVDAPLRHVQRVMVYQSLAERVLGLGTIGIGTAGPVAVELVWSMVNEPHAAAERVRQAMGAGWPGQGRETEEAAMPAGSARRMPVIGLAGGIGSGKSTVAEMMSRHGCLVIDSDQRAKAALDRPDVRSALVEWWGDTILGEDGRIDRKKVAAIIFAQPAERERLEALVHPIVRQDRAAMVAEARRGGTAGTRFNAVVIDAPLLFEAGLDAECDAVVFVDAPRQERVDRVMRNRGWTAEELERRESAQWPLERKRAASRFVVANTGRVDEMEGQILGVLGEMNVVDARG